MSLQVTPEIEITEETETELEPFYRVIIHNDDVTPMDFVVHVLTYIFALSQPDAMDVMLIAHYTGAAYVQTCPKPRRRNAQQGAFRRWAGGISSAFFDGT